MRRAPRYGRLKHTAMFWRAKDVTRIFPAGTIVIAECFGNLWCAHPIDDRQYGRHFSERRPMAALVWLSPLELLARAGEFEIAP